ncbi:MAG: methyltransferase domain-containing protein [Rickettsiales bacterium]
MNADPLRRLLYERAAARYDRYAEGHRSIAEALAQFAASHLPEGAMCLDVAAGAGAVAHAASICKNARFICADASLAMCRRNAFPSVACDMVALPFRNGAFDVAYCSMALHWAQDATQALREMRRVAPFAAIAVPVEGSLSRLHDAIANASPNLRVFSFPRVDGLLDAAQEAGWKVRAHNVALRPVTFLSAADALRHVRGWGGNNPAGDKKTPYVGRGALLRLQEAFDKADAAQETWRVLYAALQKTGGKEKIA